MEGRDNLPYPPSTPSLVPFRYQVCCYLPLLVNCHRHYHRLANFPHYPRHVLTMKRNAEKCHTAAGQEVATDTP